LPLKTQQKLKNMVESNSDAGRIVEESDFFSGFSKLIG